MTLIPVEPESVDRAGEMYSCAEDLWRAHEALVEAEARAEKASCTATLGKISGLVFRVEKRARWTEEEADLLVEQRERP